MIVMGMICGVHTLGIDSAANPNYFTWVVCSERGRLCKEEITQQLCIRFERCKRSCGSSLRITPESTPASISGASVLDTAQFADSLHLGYDR